MSFDIATSSLVLYPEHIKSILMAAFSLNQVSGQMYIWI